MITPVEFQKLFPLACDWASWQEEKILAKGVPLSDDEQIDAYLAGVKEISKVRLLAVKQMPLPQMHQLALALDDLGMMTDKTIGMTFRHGIYIRQDHWNNRELIAHELVHTAQYERLGGFRGFLAQYLRECFTVGYPNGTLEKEARKKAREICG